MTVKKITVEGQACRKCSTPVIKRIPKRVDESKSYWFAYYLWCPKCEAMYMVEAAKIWGHRRKSSVDC